MTEIIFEITEDEADGGHLAGALVHSIHEQGGTCEEIRPIVNEAFDCHFDESMDGPDSPALGTGRGFLGMKPPRNIGISAQHPSR